MHFALWKCERFWRSRNNKNANKWKWNELICKLTNEISFFSTKMRSVCLCVCWQRHTHYKTKAILCKKTNARIIYGDMIDRLCPSECSLNYFNRSAFTLKSRLTLIIISFLFDGRYWRRRHRSVCVCIILIDRLAFYCCFFVT